MVSEISVWESWPHCISTCSKAETTSWKKDAHLMATREQEGLSNKINLQGHTINENSPIHAPYPHTLSAMNSFMIDTLMKRASLLSSNVSTPAAGEQAFHTWAFLNILYLNQNRNCNSQDWLLYSYLSFQMNDICVTFIAGHRYFVFLLIIEILLLYLLYKLYQSIGKYVQKMQYMQGQELSMDSDIHWES